MPNEDEYKGLKGDNISSRYLAFAARIVKLCNALPKVQAARHISGQLIRSGTSAGANYEEARGAESKSDFIHKLGICLKESRESLYWLRVIEEAGMLPAAKMKDIIKESDELCRIIASSIKSARSR